MNYKEKLSQYQSSHYTSRKQIGLISVVRLIIFLAGILAIYFSAVLGGWASILLTVILFLVVFLSILYYDSKLKHKAKLQEAYIRLYQNEIKAREYDYSSFSEGREFIDPEHPYSFDIDLFGEGSLFQFLNRTITRIGKKRLAEKLAYFITDKEVIANRQEKIERLKSIPEWRHKFQANGMINKDEQGDKEKILDWVRLNPLFQSFFYKLMVFITPVLTISLTILLSYGEITFKLYILYLMIPFGIMGLAAKKTNTRHSLVSKKSEMLVKYSVLLTILKDLKEYGDLFFTRNVDPVIAGKEFKKLSSIVNALDNRINPVINVLFNALFLWDILQMRRLERWQKKNRDHLPNWFDLVAETDALVSLANFSYNQPKAVLPQFALDDEIIVATELGHPLISSNERVDNDVDVRHGSFALITGANMAGKSTYLRTIATNLILAMNGTVVPAREFRFRPIQLYTSVRTQDSLQKNESYFYAELKRLKAIIDQLRNGRELFIILDEILKGTNSKDKHKGSEALLKQLISLKTNGIVATHDVALGILEKTFPEHISNYCFEVNISGDSLEFDYKLRKGISQNMNATLLMRQMGITV